MADPRAPDGPVNTRTHITIAGEDLDLRIIAVLVPDQHPGIHTRSAQSQMLAVSRPGGAAEIVMRGEMEDFQ
jgi:hypothetical protein